MDSTQNSSKFSISGLKMALKIAFKYLELAEHESDNLLQSPFSQNRLRQFITHFYGLLLSCLGGNGRGYSRQKRGELNL